MGKGGVCDQLKEEPRGGGVAGWALSKMRYRFPGGWVEF